MTKKWTKREEIEMILLALKSGDYAIDVAADKLLELLERKNELRDKFAAAALQGLLAFGAGPSAQWICDPIINDRLPVADKAYEIADAMLRARAV